MGTVAPEPVPLLALWHRAAVRHPGDDTATADYFAALVRAGRPYADAAAIADELDCIARTLAAAAARVRPGPSPAGVT